MCSSDILKTNKMKKLVVLSIGIIVFLSSCILQKKENTVYNDDVYANPKDDRLEEAKALEASKIAAAAKNKRYADSVALVKQKQKEKDDANPNYKDREFKYDDYYDYEYATRVKRFNNGINGLSYYDNYYTNSYWYNQNPYNYGVSVYNGYSWWGSSYNSYSYNPSINFYNNNGWGINGGFGYSAYNGYNPYMAGYAQGYHSGFNNGVFGNYYGYGNPYGFGSSFGYPYNNYGNYYGGYGYNTGNNGWGYYNSHDLNSGYTYGPRASHGGGNSHRTSNAGMPEKHDSYYDKYINTVSEQQVHEVKFETLPTVKTQLENGSVRNPEIRQGNLPVRNNMPVRNVENEPVTPIRNNTPGIRNNQINEQINNPIKVKDIETPPPVRTYPVKSAEPVRQILDQAPRMFDTPSVPSTPYNGGGGGGGSSPSNGGGHRPR
jgi:hypothetical protein